MAKDYYVIAAGGTGAMCVQAFLFMAAAGCCDPQGKYHILMVDKDQYSDAQTACSNLYSEYKAMQAQFGKVTDTHSMPEVLFYEWNFSEAVVQEYKKKTNKKIDQIRKLTLRDILNPDGKDEDMDILLKTMYSEEELNTDLDEGFYGHPNIGAPVFEYVRAQFLSRENPFMKAMGESLKNGKTLVYLLGSLFGGTGATVVPKVILSIREMTDDSENNIGKNAVIGAAMVMPYFKLPSRNDSSAKNSVEPAETKFNQQTREALKYYHESNIMKHMMNLMLVGGRTLDVTSKVYAAGGKQTQHFHMVILLAAITAHRFFLRKLEGMEELDKQDADAALIPSGTVFCWKIKGCADTCHTLVPAELGIEEEFEKMQGFLRFGSVVVNYMRRRFGDSSDWQSVAKTHEVICTYNQEVGKREGKKPDTRKFTQDNIHIHYEVPVKQVADFCCAYFNFFYDVAQSGRDWSNSDNKAYAERWVDMADLDILKILLEGRDDPSKRDTIYNHYNLNMISSFPAADDVEGNTDNRGCYESSFNGHIGTVYENKVLKNLGMVGLGFKNYNVSFCQIYSELMKYMYKEM